VLPFRDLVALRVSRIQRGVKAPPPSGLILEVLKLHWPSQNVFWKKCKKGKVVSVLN
jgi:hypothetical protein